MYVIDPLTTAFCVAQLKYRGGPILVSEKKGCKLCHNTFSEPDCACLPGGTPVHIHCVAKKARDFPIERQHENAHHSNHTWSWSVLWGRRHMLALHLYRMREKAECIRAHARALDASGTWGSQAANKCFGVWDTIYSIHTTLTMNMNILMNVKLKSKKTWHCLLVDLFSIALWWLVQWLSWNISLLNGWYPCWLLFAYCLRSKYQCLDHLFPVSGIIKNRFMQFQLVNSFH